MASEGRRGIAAGGNWIIDHVKLIDAWPAQETLANIVGQCSGTGGAPYNVLVDLHRMLAPFPLTAIGVLGRDPDGDAIAEDMRARGIASRFRRSDTRATSFTDVMTVQSTGRRTFFHNRGANAELSPADVPLDELNARILHIGYLLLLEGMDADDPDYGTAAARVLAGARERGIRTSVDVVSEASNRFQGVVTPALPHVDYLICNEIEAGRIVGIDIRVDDRLDRGALPRAARALLDLGVNEAVVIHVPEGGFAMTAAGEEAFRPSLTLPPGYIQGAAGAGDAFCAGFLLGAHEGWPLERRLTLAVCAAAASLSDPTCCAGMLPVEELLALGERYG
ncbi:MAG TPA: carbohydrate kinase family protein [Armatimonadota bacterium]|jgi:sugar/nucleoside kinase (ribokinase family)